MIMTTEQKKQLKFLKSKLTRINFDLSNSNALNSNTFDLLEEKKLVQRLINKIESN